MKIECVIYIGLMMLFVACGSVRRTSEKDVETLREVVRQELTEMSGLGEMHGNARMSEGVSVVVTEVHFSAPDSVGKQYVMREINRRTEAKRRTETEVEVKDSVEVKMQTLEEVKEEAEVHEESNMRVRGRDSIALVLALVLIGLAMMNRRE